MIRSGRFDAPAVCCWSDSGTCFDSFAYQGLQSAHGSAKIFSGLAEQEIIQPSGEVQGADHTGGHGQADVPIQSDAVDGFSLHIREPFSARFSVGVGDFIAGLGGFASEDVFSGHGTFLFVC